MLQILSDLNLLTRMEMTADAWTLASGVTGTWVKFASTSNTDAVAKPSEGDYGVPIWSESNRDGSAGFSPDVHVTGKVTVMYGKLRAVTDQFTNSPSISVGSSLSIGADGKLKLTEDTEVAVARCTKASHTATFLGASYTSIEFVTI